MTTTVGDGFGLTEPEVLAHTKQALFSPDVETGYAVTDTQFATHEWLADSVINEEIRQTLAPFNHVRLGSGYPDLVAVGDLSREYVLDTDREATTAPLVAVEAKGYSQRSVDVERGVTQAHDRLTDANIAFVTAPTTAVTESARALARELNVGVLGVADSGSVDVYETPRTVGAQTSEAGSAIRFQATAQGVADQSFGLNHPKNYIAYPLAVYHENPTVDLMREYVVGAVESAKDGAVFLGLVEETPDGVLLTDLGQEVVRFGIELEGSLDSALERFEEWKRSQKRFFEVGGRWGILSRWLVYSYPATELLVSELQRLHTAGHSELTLREFVIELYEEHPTFAVELFIRGTETAREQVFSDETTLNESALAKGEVYASPTVFQLKAMLWHAGIVTDRGAEPNRIDPTNDSWQLRSRL